MADPIALLLGLQSQPSPHTLSTACLSVPRAPPRCAGGERVTGRSHQLPDIDQDKIRSEIRRETIDITIRLLQGGTGFGPISGESPVE